MLGALYEPDGLNVRLFNLIYSIRFQGYDQALALITIAGDHHLFGYYFTLIAIGAVMCWGVRKAHGETIPEGYARSWFSLLVVLLLSYTATGMLSGFLKSFFAVPRPSVLLEHVTPIGEAIEAGSRFRSFPSGHAIFAAMMATALWAYVWHWMRPLLLTYVGIIMWSRVALGLHFPLDVVIGALVGGACTYFISRYVRRMLHVE